MDPIADLLTRIRNGYRSRQKEVRVPHSKVKFEIARVLLEEGFISNFQVDGDVPSRSIVITVKYDEDGQSVIRGIDRVSKQSRRVYVAADGIPRVLAGLGTSILSTSKGIMTDKDARRERVGGEVICRVW